MTDFFRSFLDCVNAFFIVYLVGYSTFLFLSVVVGSIDLYQSRQRARLRNSLWLGY